MGNRLWEASLGRSLTCGMPWWACGVNDGSRCESGRWEEECALAGLSLGRRCPHEPGPAKHRVGEPMPPSCCTPGAVGLWTQQSSSPGEGEGRGAASGAEKPHPSCHVGCGSGSLAGLLLWRDLWSQAFGCRRVFAFCLPWSRFPCWPLSCQRVRMLVPRVRQGPVFPDLCSPTRPGTLSPGKPGLLPVNSEAVR